MDSGFLFILKLIDCGRAQNRCTDAGEVSMKGKDFKPLIMLSCLFVGIVALACLRSTRPATLWKDTPINPDILFITLYILWIAIEARISVKDTDTHGKNISDSATCQIYGLGQALTFLSALYFPSLRQTPSVAHFLGMSLFLLGVCYRLWAIRTLGKFYSHRVEIVSGHQIVSSGPYRFTRHPAYAGMIVANAGICMYFFNGVTLCMFAFLLTPAIVLRIMIEERTLYGIEGYAEFAAGRKRLFPAIW